MLYLNFILIFGLIYNFSYTTIKYTFINPLDLWFINLKNRLNKKRVPLFQETIKGIKKVDKIF